MRATSSLALLSTLATVAVSGRGHAYDAGTFYVTSYGYGDNSCVPPSWSSPGDCVATSGRALDSRAVYSTNNTYDHPSTLAVAGQYLDLLGPNPDGSGSYFREGDRVLIDGLGWFRVEDSCSSCEEEWPSPHIDVWMGFATYMDQVGASSVTGYYTVHVFHEGQPVPSAYRNASAGPAWRGPTWVSANRQGSWPWIWIDSAGEQWSDILVNGLVAQSNAHNSYEFNGESVTWGPYDNSSFYANASDCSGYLSTLLTRSYGYVGRRNAAGFHDRIYNGYDHFRKVGTIDQMSPGDIIAIKYDPNDPSGASGHVAVVNADSWVTSNGTTTLKAHSPPTISYKGPAPSTYDQYEVTIVDSTTVYHGTTDTRYAGGTSYQGAGKGVMRLFVDKITRAVVGYTWTLSTGSHYYGAGYTGTNPNRSILIGRYTGEP